MNVELTTTNITVDPELSAVHLEITPTLNNGGGGGGGVSKEYVDQQDALKVDKVEGKELTDNNLTDALKIAYDAAVLAAHTHPNKATLDLITEAFTTALKSAYDGAVANSHTHSNKSILDLITEAFTTSLKSNYDTAYSNTHTHSNKSILDAIEVAYTTALNANLSTAYNHSQATGNPHGTSISNLGGFPEIPTGKALFDDKTFKEVTQAGGASNLPLYMTNANSDIAGYKTLSYDQEVSETIKTITANNSTVAGEAYLSPLQLQTSLIPAGTWEFGYWRLLAT